MDFLNSFFQNIKDKLTSPFFGTLSFVLIIHHWQFWYTLFNFDKDCTRPEKTAILGLIGRQEFTWANFACDVFWALFITLIGYVVIFGTRSLSIFVDHRAMPWITGLIISKDVVLLNLHKEVVKERDEYADQYEEQRKNLRVLSKDYDNQSTQINKNNQLLNESNQTITTLNQELGRINTELVKVNADFSASAIDAQSKANELKELKTKYQLVIEANHDLEISSRNFIQNINQRTRTPIAAIILAFRKAATSEEFRTLIKKIDASYETLFDKQELKDIDRDFERLKAQLKFDLL